MYKRRCAETLWNAGSPLRKHACTAIRRTAKQGQQRWPGTQQWRYDHGCRAAPQKVRRRLEKAMIPKETGKEAAAIAISGSQTPPETGLSFLACRRTLERLFVEVGMHTRAACNRYHNARNFRGGRSTTDSGRCAVKTCASSKVADDCVGCNGDAGVAHQSATLTACGQISRDARCAHQLRGRQWVAGL